MLDDTAVTGGSSYDYRVITLNGVETSQPSASVTITAADDAAYRSWKQEMLGDPDAPDDADGDHDGLTTLEEYLFDLDPTTADHYSWSVTGPAPGNREVRVSFPSSPGRSYRVESSANMALWADASPLIPGDGNQKQWTGNMPEEEGRLFFRIVVSSP
jgi:hypothetical protein